MNQPHAAGRMIRCRALAAFDVELPAIVGHYWAGPLVGLVPVRVPAGLVAPWRERLAAPLIARGLLAVVEDPAT